MFSSATRRRSTSASITFPYSERYTSGAGSITVPSGASSVTGKVIGPGGGGARSNTFGGAFGGGGGGEADFRITLAPADVGASIPYSVGTPGSGRQGSNGPGSDATASALNTSALTNAIGTVTGSGGGGGAIGTAGAAGGAANGNDGNTFGLPGTTERGGDAGSGAAGGQVLGDSGSEFGGGGAPGNKDFETGQQYSGGNGAAGLIELTWVA